MEKWLRRSTGGNKAKAKARLLERQRQEDAMKGTLYKGTLHRVEQRGDLSEKKPLDRDHQVEYVGKICDLRAYVLEDGSLVYVEVEDDLTKASSST